MAKMIVVAGVGTGLGGQIGRLAYREGASVVLAARTANSLEAVAKGISSDGDRVHIVPTDFTDEAQCEALGAGRDGGGPHMKKRGDGSVVFTGSRPSFIPLVPQIAYASAKAALSTAMYFMAKELGPTNIRVNTVVATYMWGYAMENQVKEVSEARGTSEDEVVGEITVDMPLGRISKDEEVAEAVVFFASDRAATITGQHLLVNSGAMMR